jgi:serine protease Do
LEFALYFGLILYMIARYSNVDLDEDRRPRRLPDRIPVVETPRDPAVLLPDDATLPQPIGRVNVELENEAQNSVGTAFAVDSEGTFVTARHVVDGCDALYFTRARGGYDQIELASKERNRDFAVVSSSRTSRIHFKLTDLPLPRGSEGFMMGYPQGKPADVRATVIGKTEMRSSGRYRMREPVIAWVERERRPGFGGSLGGISGGPVFDANGNVVGTVVAGAPRRGRVYTTHPRVFEETQLVEESMEGRTPNLADGITARNFDSIGRSLRASGAIKQVVCAVS